MARQLRTYSSTGIYHVMLRGINRQIIFEQPVDYQKFIDLLCLLISPIDELGKPLLPRCRFYAYCLMPNHVHLIMKEESESLSAAVKRIAAAYALYYNKKYERYGHLFQDRFKSEPVNDAAYFVTLLRYVHQNPVAGGLCQHVEDYKWSSWGEYTGSINVNSRICSISAVPKTVQVIDFDRRKGVLSDNDVEEYLTDVYGLRHPCDLQLYTKERRNDILRAAREYGASIKQLARLTGIGEKIIRNSSGRKGS